MSPPPHMRVDPTNRVYFSLLVGPKGSVNYYSLMVRLDCYREGGKEQPRKVDFLSIFFCSPSIQRCILDMI